MKKNIMKIAFSIIFTMFILATMNPTITGNHIAQVKSSSLVDKNLFKPTLTASFRDWYWTEPYPNYAPMGLPDFSQKQNEWKTIWPGENDKIDSVVSGDDFFNSSQNCIVPGNNYRLETTPLGDDIASWSFDGPAAVANSFWWFDSKEENPIGYPGDGINLCPLVEDYGAGDDHSTLNAPLLIQRLADYMTTNRKGNTNISDMKTGIEKWLNCTNLTKRYIVNQTEKPSFDFIRHNIEQSKIDILLLGYYNHINDIDQRQTEWVTWIDLPIYNPGHIQSFTPNTSSLDTVELLIHSDYITSATVEVSIFDIFPGDITVEPLETSTKIIEVTTLPQWFRFQFEPSLNLIPQNLYFICVRTIDSNTPIHWCYTSDEYANGATWWCIGNYSYVSNPYYDFAFKTGYTTGEYEHLGDHFVTCAGVNSEESQIAFSDPWWDIQNTSATPIQHNNPQYVSHDIYTIELGTPCQGLDYPCWISGYPMNCDYVVIENEITINNAENEPPYIEIFIPKNGYFYTMDIEWTMPGEYTFTPIILGKLNIIINASDSSGIDSVWVAIDSKQKEQAKPVTDVKNVYEYKWTIAFGIHMINVTAYDNIGNSAYYKMEAWKFF